MFSLSGSAAEGKARVSAREQGPLAEAQRIPWMPHFLPKITAQAQSRPRTRIRMSQPDQGVGAQVRRINTDVGANPA